MKNIFLRKTYLASSFFVIILSFFISMVFFLVRLSMLMIYLSWALYYANKIGSNSWGHSESRYALMEGRGGTPKTSENIQGEGGLPKVYDKIYFFEGVFSHLKCLFCFGVVLKTLTPWEVALYIPANLTPPRYLDISFWECNVQMQFDYNFFQLKKNKPETIWTLFE